jgi:hypothetical protein
MRHQLNSIFRSVFICLALTSVSYAQDIEIDSLALTEPLDTLSLELNKVSAESETAVAIEVDSIAPRVIYPFLKEVGIVLDYGKVFGYLTGFEKKNEIGLSLNIKKSFVFLAEAGYSTLNPNDAYVNADYEVKGMYFRLGGGVTKTIKSENNISFSVRYASSNFEDRGIANVTSASGIFDSYEQSFSRQSMSASWYEFVLGSEKRIRPKDENEKPKLYVGFYFRIRVMNKYDIQEPFDVFTIPGYGRTFDNTVPALNLYLRYVISSKGPSN